MFKVEDTFQIKGRGTVIVYVERGSKTRVRRGDVLEFRAVGTAPRRVEVLGVEAMHVSPPPEPGTCPVGILLPSDVSKDSLVGREAWLIPASEATE